MRTKILNYRIIVSPDEQTGTGKPSFTAFCPTLGIADDGKTVEEALDNIRNLIPFHLKCLHEEGREVPVDHPDLELVTNTQIKTPFSNFRFAV